MIALSNVHITDPWRTLISKVPGGRLKFTEIFPIVSYYNLQKIKTRYLLCFIEFCQLCHSQFRIQDIIKIWELGQGLSNSATSTNHLTRISFCAGRMTKICSSL